MSNNPHRILIFGAGVIGSIFGGKLAAAEQDVTLLAQNTRLAELQENGIRIQQMNRALEEKFRFLQKSDIGIEPWKFQSIRFVPLWLLNWVMKLAFNTKWAETVISTIR